MGAGVGAGDGGVSLAMSAGCSVEADGMMISGPAAVLLFGKDSLNGDWDGTSEAQATSPPLASLMTTERPLTLWSPESGRLVSVKKRRCWPTAGSVRPAA